jgi:callose synthase
MAQYSPIQIKVAVSAVFSVRSLPSVNMKDEKNHTDILRWLQSWFGFQVNDLFCFMQNA